MRKKRKKKNEVVLKWKLSKSGALQASLLIEQKYLGTRKVEVCLANELSGLLVG